MYDRTEQTLDILRQVRTPLSSPWDGSINHSSRLHLGEDVVNSLKWWNVDWIPFDAFSNIKFLARGGFATVFTAELEVASGKRTYALKKIGKRISSENVDEACRCVLSLCDG